MRTLGLALIMTLLSACAHERQIESVSASEDVLPVDPAVTLANELAGDGTPYRQGVSGTGDERIHYVEAGQGPTVLFVHGFPSFWYVWRDQMEALRHCRRVIAIDAPGAGFSAKPEADEAYRIDRLAARLHALIDELAPGETITLVGHDWGGALAWSYADWNSSRLDRLAIFSAPSYNLLLDLLADDPEQRAASSYMPRLLRMDRDTASSDAFKASFYDLAYRRMVEDGILSESEGMVFQQALARDGALHAGIQWYKANMPGFDNFDTAALYWPHRTLSTDIPILLVRGSEDRTFVKGMQDSAKRDAPQLDVVTLQGVGHWTPFQEPDAANRALMDFVLGDGRSCQALRGLGTP